MKTLAPVPHVSTSAAGSGDGTRTIARRSAPTAPASSAGVSPLTRSPTSSAAICAGDAEPAMMSSNAAPDSTDESDCPAASALIACESASATPQCPREAFRQPRLRRGERAHEPEQPHALDVFLDKQPALHAIRQVHDANQLVVVDERERDE